VELSNERKDMPDQKVSGAAGLESVEKDMLSIQAIWFSGRTLFCLRSCQAALIMADVAVGLAKRGSGAKETIRSPDIDTFLTMAAALCLAAVIGSAFYFTWLRPRSQFSDAAARQAASDASGPGSVAERFFRAYSPYLFRQRKEMHWSIGLHLLQLFVLLLFLFSFAGGVLHAPRVLVAATTTGAAIGLVTCWVRLKRKNDELFGRSVERLRSTVERSGLTLPSAPFDSGNRN
jgi:hypothetical protein